MSSTGDFDMQDIRDGDHVVVIAPTGSDCHLKIPKTDMAVWIARVVDIELPKRKGGAIHLEGYFFYNEQNYLSKPLQMRNVIEAIEFEENCVLGVYEKGDAFKLSDANVRQIRAQAIAWSDA